jgi:uncharacterized repeat protein (TIGR03803 family)
LIIDGSGNLYGTTVSGGISVSCCGTVFQLAPNGTETVLHVFGESDGDGIAPYAGLIADADGNLYGTTFKGGGEIDAGTVFKLAPNGTETVLHTFTGGSDGYGPYTGALLMDNAGDLYGTTYAGGSTGCHTHEGCGTVFKLAPGGTETELYVFKSQKDGVYPESGVIADGAGNLYGTTSFGGLSKYGPGVVYKINVDTPAKH